MPSLKILEFATQYLYLLSPRFILNYPISEHYVQKICHSRYGPPHFPGSFISGGGEYDDIPSPSGENPDGVVDLK
jgi:hypothetical protein